MALDQDIDLLARQPLLGLLPREALRLLAFAAETRILRAGDILFRKGDIADGGWLVLSGALALDAKGDGAAGQTVLGPGALAGEMALFTPVERPATAIAREPTTVSRIARTVMTRVLGEFPDGAAAVHAALGQRVSEFSGRLAPVADRLRALD
jgi:CRP-like cAMP-binding protein